MRVERVTGEFVRDGGRRMVLKGEKKEGEWERKRQEEGKARGKD